VPFFAFASGIRTINAVEALAPMLAQDHQDPRPLSQRWCGALTKLPYLAIKNSSLRWRHNR